MEHSQLQKYQKCWSDHKEVLKIYYYQCYYYPMYSSGCGGHLATFRSRWSPSIIS